MLSEPIALVIGSVLGVVASIGAAYTSHHFDTKRKSNGLKAAITGEVSAILHLIRLNNYIEGVSKVINDLKSGSVNAISVSVKSTYSQVYESNLSSIGIIGPISKEIVLFYKLLGSALEDKNTIDDTVQELKKMGAPSPQQLANIAKRLLLFHEFLLKKLNELISRGDKLILELDR
jgi:hypothetical protein